MKFAKFLVTALASASFLAGCGGGSSFQPSSTPGTGTSAVTSIAVSSSSAIISQDGTKTATITGLLRDASNNFVSGETVTFAASSGGGLAITQAKSDSSGVVTATIQAVKAADGTPPAVGTVITVTVTSSTGKVSGSAKVTVGNAAQTLTLTTNQAQLPSDGSKTATLTALVRDASNNVVSGVPVSFSSTGGALAAVDPKNFPLTGGAITTDSNGVAQVVLSTTDLHTNRTITVSASLAGATPVSVPVNVTGTTLTFSGPTSIVTGNGATYTLQLRDSAGTGLASTPVAITSKLGNAVTPTVTTNATGQATVTLTATIGGAEVLTASAIGLAATQAIAISAQSFSFTAPAAGTTQKINLSVPYTATVQWKNNGSAVVGQPITFSTTRGALSGASLVTDAQGQAQVTIQSTNAGPAILSAAGAGVSANAGLDFIATTPSTITIQASVTSVPTTGTSTIIAVVRDPTGNLVEGQTVDFVLQDITNGQLSVGSAVTDGQGTAQTIYTASSSSSAKDGVVITATVHNSSPAISATTKMTVGGQALFLSLGTGNKVIDTINNAEFAKDWSVRAVDAQGVVVPNVTITFGVRSLQYGKGIWTVPQGATSWVQTVRATCANEDVNGTGILGGAQDPTTLCYQEDTNCNGRLDPGSVATISPSTGVTDATGLLQARVFWPRDHCDWVKVQISATAIVQGTEAQSATADVYLDCLASDITNTTASPPGQTSPYGVQNTCTDPN
jgi:Bacterial Ig-like domain (group 1)